MISEKEFELFNDRGSEFHSRMVRGKHVGGGSWWHDKVMGRALLAIGRIN